MLTIDPNGRALPAATPPPLLRRVSTWLATLLFVLPGLSPALHAQTTPAAPPAATPLPISNVPLTLSPPLPPNLFVTIDDSGSMAWGHIPDTLFQNLTTNANAPGTAEPPPTGQAGGGANGGCGAACGGQGLAGTCTGVVCGAARGYKSAALNPLYYDPTVTYAAPPDATGVALTTAFQAAYLDGFNPATSGAVNLATGYRPTATYFPGSTLAAPWAPGAAAASVAGCPDPSNFLCNSWAGHNALDFTALNVVSSYQPTYAYYYNYVSGNPGCTASLYDDRCYTLVKVGTTSGPGGTDETQNFANWYSFYRIRHLAMVTAAARAMSDPTLATARVAWQAIDSCNTGFNVAGSPTCSGWGGPLLENSIQRFTGTHKNDFYTFLQYLPAAGGTPMRTALDRVGQFLQNTGGANGPWGFDPNQTPAVTNGPELSCRKNFHIMLTDGEWNLASVAPPTGEQGVALCGNAAGCGNADSTPITLPDGTAFTPGGATAIYNDQNSNSLSDIAFYYWSHDLNPDGLANNLTTQVPQGGSYWNPQNDPATWHHLVNFTVGLGLDKFMIYPPLWAGSTYAGAGYQGLLNGTMTWPQIAVGDATASVFPGFTGTDDPAKVYDLWHAAIDSRGQAFSASTPQGLLDAFNAFIGEANFATSGASAATANSTSLRTGSDLFQASYQSSDWHGTVRAFPLIFSGNLNGNGTYTVSTQFDWSTDRADTANVFLTPNTRNIITYSAPSNSVPMPAPAPQALPLTQASLTAAGLWTTPLINDPNVLAWLRGDQSNEQSVANPNGTLRARPVSVLGDIVDSQPVFSYDENFGYDSLPGLVNGVASGATAYSNYLLQTKVAAGRPPMLYVGANDGMLHGFALTENAATGRVTGGAEQFAYMPNAVLANVSALASTNYTHQFYVDGSPFVGDAFLGGAWHTVLVGLTGAGGKSAFALDVTNPQSFGVNNVLWEIDATGPSGGTVFDADLGDTIGQPIIAPLNDGKWYAIFGNGYDSVRQCAVLYLVQLDTGTVHKLDTSTGGRAGTANCTTSNGLGSPTLLDVNGDRVIDYIYAGDQLGNMWKFDVTAAAIANWNVPSPAGVPLPLFTAVSPAPPNAVQPITAAPEIGPPPTGRTGAMIYFGTGRYFATTDPANTTTQSFYGILDPLTPITATITRAASPLLQQTITPIAGVDGPETGRSVSQNTLTQQDDGWFLDLPDSGERVLGTPLVLEGEVFFSTVVPGTTTCAAGGTSFIMAVNSGSGAGGGTDGAFFRTQLGGADGILSSVGVVTSLSSISDPANSNDVVLAGGPGGVEAFSVPTKLRPQRTSWQELIP
jgi:type IV pilus assembly protein PilY1